MTSDDSDSAETKPVNAGHGPAAEPAVEAGTKPPARDRVAVETAPVQIQPNGR